MVYTASLKTDSATAPELAMSSGFLRNKHRRVLYMPLFERRLGINGRVARTTSLDTDAEQADSAADAATVAEAVAKT